MLCFVPLDTLLGFYCSCLKLLLTCALVLYLITALGHCPSALWSTVWWVLQYLAEIEQRVQLFTVHQVCINNHISISTGFIGTNKYPCNSIPLYILVFQPNDGINNPLDFTLRVFLNSYRVQLFQHWESILDLFSVEFVLKHWVEQALADHETASQSIFQFIYPFSSAYYNPFQGQGQAYPRCVRGRVHPGQVVSLSQG